MPHDPHEAAIIAWVHARNDVRMALLTSTRAIPTARRDVLSDYDLILVVDSIRPFASNRGWITDFGEVLVVYWDALPEQPLDTLTSVSNVTQYADGLKIDFTIWPTWYFVQQISSPVLPDELDAGYRVLVDKDLLQARMPSATGQAYLPKRPTEEQYQTWVNDFLTDPPFVAKCLWRDELFPAKWCLESDMILLYLRQMLEWRIGVETKWAVPVGNLGKGMKNQLPPALWQQIENCFAGSNREELWGALFQTMLVFRMVAQQAGEALGYSYPDELHRQVVAYVEQIRAMPRPASDLS